MAGTKSTQGLLHPPGHIAVKDVVGRKTLSHASVPTPDLKRGTPILSPAFGLVTARNDATVVVGQNNHRAAVQTWIEHPLTTHEKVVAIGQGKHLIVFLLHSGLSPKSKKYCLR